MVSFTPEGAHFYIGGSVVRGGRGPFPAARSTSALSRMSNKARGLPGPPTRCKTCTQSDTVICINTAMGHQNHGIRCLRKTKAKKHPAMPAFLFTQMCTGIMT